MADRHGRTPDKAAIAWTLHHPAVTAAIVGARNPGQVGGIVGGGDWKLASVEIAEIEP